VGYKVGLTDAAEADLESLVRFIAEKNREAALRIGEDVLDTTPTLAMFPRRGSPVRRGSWIEIVRIWDGRQNPSSLRLP
jgi:plasmid stabilization system protein ParE